MFIKELTLTNFKSFTGDPTVMGFNVPNGSRGSGLNIFVGENNTGKSTIFEAVDFLRNGTKKLPEDIRNKNCVNVASVQLLFEGDVESVIDGYSQPNKVGLFKSHVYGAGDQKLKFSRDTDNAKAIRVWSEDDGEYKNPAGIDAPVKKLFETNFVWADTNPNDQASFGATTICGSLLKEISNGFKETVEYAEFAEKFHETFNSDRSGLRRALMEIEEKTQQIFQEQFGSAGISFRFDELDTSAFFKNTVIEVDDGVKTSMEEKGSGMQRAVALAMLQVYAEQLTKNPEDAGGLEKPFFLFIDEPEICLHPKAQEKLLHALLDISASKQVFLTTHSPYFIAMSEVGEAGLFVFKVENDASVIEKLAGGDGLFPWSPTWGEVNFKAYNLPTVEFHNELYGRLQELTGKYRLDGFEGWLTEHGVALDKQWTRERDGVPGASSPSTVQTFIRNKVHHPENQTMQLESYSKLDLEGSIRKMIGLLPVAVEAQGQEA